MSSRAAALMLLVLYGLSGVTALAYEVLWTRMLSLMFGISIFGVVVTVAAFMVGLGAGSLRLSRAGASIEAPRALRWFALLEGGVAIYALLLPVMMPLLDRVLMSMAGGLSLAGWQLLQGVAVLLLLTPAAMAMGMAFPLVLRAAGALRLSLGAVYGVNALGGAIGALLPLWLLPWLGWQQAVWSVAGLGGVIALLALLLAPRLTDPQSTHPEEGGAARTAPPWIDLIAYAGIGAAALMLEVLWTREYGMVLLRTEYVLAVLLSVYLVGIGLGSLLAPRLHRLHGLMWLPFAGAVVAIAGQYLLAPISQWAAAGDFSSLAAAMIAQGGVVALVTLPVTLILGAWLPLLAAHLDGGRVHGGWLYGANCVGAAAGALLAGFVLLPLLGSAQSLLLAALLLFVSGMRWVEDRRLWLLLAPMVLLAWPVRALPPVASLLPALADSRVQRLYEDAVSLTHVVVEPDGQRLLLSDLQRMDASSEPTAVTVQKNQARLPLLLHPHAESVLFLGLGTGITAAGSLPFGGLKARVAVELSQGAIDAAKTAFAPVNGDIGRRITLIHDDARRFLRREKRSYDVIVGDLFHPDMVGRANLLSRQQFERARARLRAGGLFAQWLALNQFDVRSLQVVLNTFAAVFPRNALFVDGYRVGLIGFRDDLPNFSSLRAAVEAMPAAARSAATGGEGIWSWLGRYWGAVPPLATPLQDEWAPVIEYRLPKVRYGGGVDMDAMWRWLLSWRAGDAQAMARFGVAEADRAPFKRARVATALNVRLWQAELHGDERRAVEMARLARRANPRNRWPAFALADRMFDSLRHRPPAGISYRQALTRILAIRPDHEGAIRAMLKLARDAGDAAQIAHWRARLAAVSPLAIDVDER